LGLNLVAFGVLEKIDDQANAKRNQNLQNCSTIKTKLPSVQIRDIINKLEEL
jgi:hypothetical protein